MIEVGQKVRFDMFDGIVFSGYPTLHVDKVGTIVEIHEDHQWFSVEYMRGKNKPYPGRISFKFDDIGRKVFLIK